jgi:hypothetical protein
MADLAFLENINCFIGTANTKFKNFQRFPGQLGGIVNLELPPRFTTTNSLVVNWQPVQQRLATLTCDQQVSAAIAITADQLVFNNMEEYSKRLGMGAIKEISAKIESNVALNAVTNTYRFYGNGVTPIDSFVQLANAVAMFRNYGAAEGELKCYLPDVATPNIIGTGQNQFTPMRGDRTAKSWELGEFKQSTWYESNKLPIHIAGTEGLTGNVNLTVSSWTNNGVNGAIDTITFSNTTNASDANSVAQYDKFQFQDNVTGQPNLRALTFIGHTPSANPVQFAATQAAGSTSGSLVTVTINPQLQSAAANNQNLNAPIAVGMKVKVMPSHRAGLITGGDPLFIAMPELPATTPFPSGTATDPETQVSLRAYYGTIFGTPNQGFVHDAIWGSLLIPEYSMSVLFPV